MSKPISVFIIRPSDVEDFYIDGIKKLCSKLSNTEEGFIYFCRDFKDLIAEAGHPQKKIDKAIKSADIVIALIQNSVGTKVGFQHEVALCEDLSSKGLIEFGIYFYGKSEDVSVKKYKSIISSEGRHLYVSFNDQNDLTTEVSAKLNHSFFRMKNQLDSLSENVLDSVEEKNPSRKKHDKSKGKELALFEVNKSDLAESIQSVGNSLSSGKKISDFEQIRLFFYSASLLYGQSLPSEIVGNHEMQLLYKFKEKVNFTGDEMLMTIHCLFSDEHELRLGWYWLQSFIQGDMSGLLAYASDFLIYASNQEVKIGALGMLKRFWKKEYYKSLQKLDFQTENNVVVYSIFEIIESYPDKESLKIIERILKNKSIEEKVKNSARLLEIKLLFKYHPIRAINYLKDASQDEYYPIKANLFKKLTVANLKLLSESKSEYIANIALNELISKRKLKKEELIQFLDKGDSLVRSSVIKRLINIGYPISIKKIKELFGDEKLFDNNQDEVVAEYFTVLEQEELEKHIKWNEIYSPKAYEIAGVRFFDKRKGGIRKDLEDGFKDKFGRNHKISLVPKTDEERRAVERLKAAYKALENHDSFIIGSFTEAALKILLEKGGRKDLNIAKNYLHHSEAKVRELSYRIIAKYGEQKDAEYLFEAALKESKKYKKSTPTLGALKLDKSSNHKIAIKMLESEDEEMIKFALSHSIKEKNELELNFVIPFLKNKDTRIRKLATFYIIFNFKKIIAEEVLKNYYLDGTYYYNVTCWFDRLLYSPKKLKASYKKDFSKEIDAIMRGDELSILPSFL